MNDCYRQLHPYKKGYTCIKFNTKVNETSIYKSKSKIDYILTDNVKTLINCNFAEFIDKEITSDHRALEGIFSIEDTMVQ